MTQISVNKAILFVIRKQDFYKYLHSINKVSNSNNIENYVYLHWPFFNWDR